MMKKYCVSPEKASLAAEVAATGECPPVQTGLLKKDSVCM